MKRENSAQTQTASGNHRQANIKSTSTIRTLPDREKETMIRNERIRIFLRKLARNDMKVLINQLHLSDNGLNFLRDGIASGEEDHEICAVVEEIKRDRLLDPFWDSGDHLNYTNF